VGAAQEAVVLEFLAAWGDGDQAAPDIEKLIGLFTPDAVWQLYVPDGPVLRGHDEIRADLERQLGFAANNKAGIVHMTSSDTAVMTERLDHFDSRGTTIDHHLMAIYEITPDGKISAWREYFDPGDVNQQLRAAAKAAREGGAGGDRRATSG
jgi:limonene-1,2-epoxide hydrolase